MDADYKENEIKISSKIFSKPIFTLSNFFSIVHLALLPVILYMISEEKIWWAVFYLALGGFTDFLDGFTARRMKTVSDFGKILDPFVDKSTVIIILGYLAYRYINIHPTYPFILIFGTGFMVFIALSYLVAVPIIIKKSGTIPSSNISGKVAGAFSVIAVGLYILDLNYWADAWMIVTIGVILTAGVIYFLRDIHHKGRTIRITWANRITLLRIVLSPLFLLVFFQDGEGSFDDNSLIFKSLALILIIALVVSDKIDGDLARSKNEVSELGKLLDPFADKIALMTVFLCFVATGWVSVWLVTLIYYREATISFLRTLAATERIVLAAQPSGKIKTAVQSGVAITLISLSFIRELADATSLSLSFGIFFDIWDYAWTWLPQALMIFVAIISIVSGVDYLWRNRMVILSALQKGNK